MNAFEKHIAKNMENHGWFTEIHEKEQITGIIDILAYKPKSGKMFYGNLSQLTQARNKEIMP